MRNNGGNAIYIYLHSFWFCILQDVDLCIFSAFDYPFYGVQWHPEKNNFEWSLNENIPHSDHATVISQTAANFFVQEGNPCALPGTFVHTYIYVC